MVRGYPYQGKADKDYIGAVAEVLLRYPRKVAVACVHPIDGVARECKDFMPSAPNVIDWCERATRPLRDAVVSEARIEEQLRAREEWKPSSRPTGEPKNWITYEQHLKAAAEGRTKPRPIGAFETGGYLGPMSLQRT